MSIYATNRAQGGLGSGVTSLDGMTGAITLVAGAHITIVDGVGTITISSSDAGGLTIGTFDSGTPSANGAHIDSNQLIMQSASATVPGLMNIGTQTFAGIKTFNTQVTVAGTLIASGGQISLGDNTTAAATSAINRQRTDGILSLSGATGAGVGGEILLFGSTASVNNGIRFRQSSTNVLVVDAAGKFTIGASGGTQIHVINGDLSITGAASASNLSGTNTGDITLGTANGLSLVGQALSLALSSTSTTGALSDTDWNTFNGKQGTVAIGALDAQAANANGLALVANVLSTQSADATHPGMVNTTTQSFAGNKTFTGTIAASNLSGTNTGDITLAAFGSTPNANGASLSSQALNLQPADSTNPGGVSTGTQTFGGAKTFASTVTSTGTLTATVGFIANGGTISVGDNSTATATNTINRQRTDGILLLTGGTGSGVGGELLLFGSTASVNNGIRLRQSGTNVMLVDASAKFTIGVAAGTQIHAINGSLSITGSLNGAAAQTTLTGAAGTAVCSQPMQGTSHKKVVIYLNGYTDTGTQTYTFPTAFSHTPFVSGLTTGVAGATASTTTVTFTVTTLTGFVFLEGF